MATKRLTPLQVVREKCKDCCGDLKEARKCELSDCALYHHKAGKKDGEQTMTASKAIKEYCKQCCNNNSKEIKLCTSAVCPIYMFNKQKETEREERTKRKEAKND